MEAHGSPRPGPQAPAATKTSDFDYYLPPERIAQTPAEPRDSSRLLVLPRDGGPLQHRRFAEMGDYLREGDLLVGNDSRVIPARLRGRKAGNGGRAEVLLLRRLEPGLWEGLVRPGRRLPVGTIVDIMSSPGCPEAVPLSIEVVGREEGGVRRLRLSSEEGLEEVGEVPLPPYVHTPLADRERYQTVYASAPGSVAAPTAGLHFTPRLMGEMEGRGVRLAFVTLHVGLDSFKPVESEDPALHPIHREWVEVRPETAAAVSEARAEGRRVLAVGTTTVRALEQASLASPGDRVLAAYSGWADLFIRPGYAFRAVDGLVTNFHLPRSTLLMLVCAFARRERALAAYNEAIRAGYRFYSFGDAMLVV
ncbi:MAG: tRNA preQ1(34) S-adenosylmethionine ribosyltransferase-isomerase QueA [Chloroflexi bacterium]|nr:tRNA preQ1(34) S-adenosylmethionine ribosyltransferase-isomerase QueA [Chloroflexota bacterium]